MKIDPSCVTCGRQFEDGGHLFFKCKLAKQIWRLLGLDTERTQLAAIHDAFGAVEFILTQTESKRELIVITLWFIWSERNNIREGKKKRPAEIIVRSIELYAHENLLTINSNSSAPSTVGHVCKNWSKPPENCLKLNVDGSFRPYEKNGSWGCLIRDKDGDVVTTGRGRIDNLLSAFQAELIACLQGIQVAADLGIGHLILETDAQEVVSAIKSSTYDDSIFGHLIEELKVQASLNFITFECIHVSRDCNRAAHELACLGFFCVEGDGVFTDSIPSNIAVIVANDSVSQ